MALSKEIPFSFWYDLLTRNGGIDIEEATKLYQINPFFRQVVLELLKSKRVYRLKNYIFGDMRFTHKQDETFINQIKSISTSYGYALYLTKDGRVYVYGFETNYNRPTPMIGGTKLILLKLKQIDGKEPKIKAIAASHDHFLILSEDGNIYSSGNNKYGQLGSGYEIQDEFGRRETRKIIKIENKVKIKAISTSSFHSLILSEEGDVYSFGRNDKGQLGVNDFDHRNKPTLIKLEKDGNKVNVKAISAGVMHSLILTEDGDVYSFGRNDEGQLGLEGPSLPVTEPHLIVMTEKIKVIAAGDGHSLILTENGNVYSFGDNSRGHLGLGPDVNQKSIPTLIDLKSITGKRIKIKAISTSEFNSLILTEDEDVYSFGIDINGKFEDWGGLPEETTHIPTLVKFKEKFKKVKLILSSCYNILIQVETCSLEIDQTKIIYWKKIKK